MAILTTKWSFERRLIEEEILGSGKLSLYTYDLGNRLIKKEERYETHSFITRYLYNRLNQLIIEKDPYGQKTLYSYDRLGNQIKAVQSARQESSGKIIIPIARQRCNLLSQPIKKMDENGFITDFSYNTYGSPTEIIHPDNSIERFTYYTSGWLKQKWRADQTSICYVYDPKGRLLKETTLDSTGIPIKEEEFTYSGPLLISKKDGMGIVTEYEYDGAGRKTAEIVDKTKITRYSYDDFGRISKIFYALNQEEGRYQLFEYDALDRLLSKTLKGTNDIIYSKENYSYDLQGNQVQKSYRITDSQTADYRFHYNSDGTLASKENPLNHKTTYTYDHENKNNLEQRVCSSDRIDPLGRVYREIQDAYHLPEKQLQFSPSRKLLSYIEYSYDALGNNVKEHVTVMEEGLFIRDYTILRTYTNRGQLQSEREEPEGKITRYSYDGMNRLIKKEKPDGVTLHYSYDALGRMIKQHSSDGTIDYNYFYDLHDNLIKVEDLISGIIQKRIFDSLNRLISEEISPGLLILYSYDSLDRLTHVLLPDRSSITYNYDPFHLKEVKRLDQSKELYNYQCLEYDKRGHLLKGSSPAGTTQFNFDLLGRYINIETSHWWSELNCFDAAGNLLKINQRDGSGQFSQDFSYDSFDQIISETANHYTYDSLGNCLKKNDIEYQIGPSNQISSDGESDYIYDLNGNLIEQNNPPISYKYDALNRLIESDKISFLYDAFGRCIQITDAKGTHQLLYQKNQEIGSYLNGQMNEFRIVHPNPDNEMIFAIELKGEPFFPVQDHRYNISALQTKEGTLAKWYRYSAFGSTESYGQELNNPWRFANRREIAGLSLFTHRFYNPSLMRWQTTDPLGFTDGLNLYTYVHNNPHTYIDPNGQFAFVIPLFTIAFGGGAAAFALPSTAALMNIAAGAAFGYCVYEVAKRFDTTCLYESDYYSYMMNQMEEEGENKWKEKNEPRTEPRDLPEQLTLAEAEEGAGEEIMYGQINDPRYPPDEWKKQQHKHTMPNGTDSTGTMEKEKEIVIHYWEHRQTGERHGFKFKKP